MSKKAPVTPNALRGAKRLVRETRSAYVRLRSEHLRKLRTGAFRSVMVRFQGALVTERTGSLWAVLQARHDWRHYAALVRSVADRVEVGARWSPRGLQNVRSANTRAGLWRGASRARREGAA